MPKTKPTPPNMAIPDGLYRVVHKHFVAGYVMKGGKCVACAPILRNKLRHWMTFAEFVRPPVGVLTTEEEKWIGAQ